MREEHLRFLSSHLMLLCCMFAYVAVICHLECLTVEVLCSLSRKSLIWESVNHSLIQNKTII